jgi:hypothetical protein
MKATSPIPSGSRPAILPTIGITEGKVPKEFHLSNVVPKKTA